MSVLNKMLKDLEQRQGQVTQHAGIPSGVQVLGQASRSRLTSMVLLAAIGLILAASAIIGWWMSQRNVPPAASVHNASASAPAAIPVPMAAVATVVAASSSHAAASLAPPVASLPTATTTLAPPPPAAASPTAPALAAPATTVSAPRREASVAVNTLPSVAVPAPAAPDSPPVKQVSATQSAEYQYQQALAAVQQGRTSEAVPLLRSALQTAARHQAARHLLVGLLLNDGKNEEAVELLREGQQLAPTDLDTATMLARLQVEAGAINVAINTLQLSLPHAGGSGAYLAFKASLHQKQNDHTAATVLLTRALQIEPGNGRWLLALAVSQQALGQGVAARTSAEAALASGNLPGELQTMARQLAP